VDVGSACLDNRQSPSVTVLVIIRLYRRHTPHKMRHVTTDVASSVVCLSVCLSVCVSIFVLVTWTWSAKTAEPIKMPFGELNRVSLSNHVLNGVSGAILGIVRPTETHWEFIFGDVGFTLSEAVHLATDRSEGSVALTSTRATSSKNKKVVCKLMVLP